jgi:hypothetical protein
MKQAERQRMFNLLYLFGIIIFLAYILQTNKSKFI